MPRLPHALNEALRPSYLGIAAGVFLALAAMAFAKPLEAMTSTPSGYEHVATYGYSAPAAASIVYGDGTVDVGDPIFRSVVHALAVDLDYRLEGADDVDGSVTLRTVVRVGQWEHVVASEDPVRLDGGVGRATTRIDLDAVDDIVEEFAEVSGQSAPGAVVVVGASIEAVGSASGERFSTAFTPELELAVTPAEVRIDPATLEQRGSESVSTHAAADAELDVLGRSLPVRSARTVGIAGSLLLGAAAAARASTQRRGPGARTLERTPDDPRILHVTSFETVGSLVEVDDLDTLLRVAEDFDRFVLCVTDDIGRRTYAVDHGTTTYRTATTWVP